MLKCVITVSLKPKTLNSFLCHTEWKATLWCFSGKMWSFKNQRTQVSSYAKFKAEMPWTSVFKQYQGMKCYTFWMFRWVFLLINIYFHQLCICIFVKLKQNSPWLGYIWYLTKKWPELLLKIKQWSLPPLFFLSILQFLKKGSWQYVTNRSLWYFVDEVIDSHNFQSSAWNFMSTYKD